MIDTQNIGGCGAQGQTERLPNTQLPSRDRPHVSIAQSPASLISTHSRRHLHPCRTLRFTVELVVCALLAQTAVKKRTKFVRRFQIYSSDNSTYRWTRPNQLDLAPEVYFIVLAIV